MSWSSACMRISANSLDSPRSLFLNQPEVSVMPGAELLLALLDQLLCSLEITLLGAIDRLDVTGARRADARDDLKANQLYFLGYCHESS